MDHAVICHPYFDREGYVSCFDYFEFEGIEIPCGIIDIAETERPQIGPKQVLVKTKAFSCNYRDRSLLLAFNHSCQNMESPMFSPFGSDFVAEVIEVGNEVETVRAGDRVIADGAYPVKEYSAPGLPTNFASQRYQVMNYDQIIRIPSHMPDETAAAFTVGSQTAYGMIRRLGIRENENILLLSATSNTSLFALMALKNRYENIYAVTTRARYNSELTESGVKECVTMDGLPDLAERVHGFDVVIDPHFDIHFPLIPPVMNQMGRYITCGLCNQYGNVDYRDLFDVDSYATALTGCIARNITVIGNCLGSREDLQTALNDYEKGRYDIFIDSVYHNDVKSFLHRSYIDTERLGKVVFKYEDCQDPKTSIQT